MDTDSCSGTTKVPIRMQNHDNSGRKTRMLEKVSAVRLAILLFPVLEK